MKRTHYIIIGMLVLFGVLCVCSAVSAITITKVKVGGQDVPWNFWNTAVTTNTILNRKAFEKNPTVEFDVVWDQENALNVPPHDINTCVFYATILIGSNDLFNTKDVWLGMETGTYATSPGRMTIDDPWYGPLVKKSLEKGQRYQDTIRLTPGVTHYTYTLTNPDVLCFDAHLYGVVVYVSAYDPVSSYYAGMEGPEWEFTSGDNSDDNYNSFYSSGGNDYWLGQEFVPSTSFDINTVGMKLYRIGVLPANAMFQASIYKGKSSSSWTPDRSKQPVWQTYPLNGTVMNAITTSASGAYYSFYSSSPSARLDKGTSYVLVLHMTNGDNTHKIAWRKDTGMLGFPHYTKGTFSWNYASSSNGGSTWVSMGDTFMFNTYGTETTLSYTIGNIHYQTYTMNRCFVFDTYGPTVDRTSAYAPDSGYATISHYVHTKQNVGDTTSLFLGNMYPAHLNMGAGDVVGKGASFDTASVRAARYDSRAYVDTKVPVTVILCDKFRNIIDYAVVDSYFPVMGTYPFMPLGPNAGFAGLNTVNEFRLLQYTVGAKQLESRGAYYIYIGVPAGIYTYSNTYITVDDTMRKTNWSITALKVGSNCSASHDLTYDFMGAYSYFETQVAYTDQSTTGAFRTTPSFVTNFVIWCSNSPKSGGLGMPWVAVLFGFLPAIILVGVLWSFMRRWHISLPNFIYSIAAVAGLYVSWNIGLLAFWIFITITVSLFFASMYQYREPISQALQTASAVRGASAMSGISARARQQAGRRGSWKSLLQPKDEGVFPHVTSRSEMSEEGWVTKRPIPEQIPYPTMGESGKLYFFKKKDKGVK